MAEIPELPPPPQHGLFGPTWYDWGNAVSQSLARVEKNQKTILALLQQSFQWETRMTKEFDNLMAEVEATRTTEDSIMKLVDALVAAKDDPTKFQALADELKAKRAEVDAKVLASTPAAPSGGGTPAPSGAPKAHMGHKK